MIICRTSYFVLLNQFSVKYRFPLQVLRFTVESPSVTQPSCSQENALKTKQNKTPSPFFFFLQSYRPFFFFFFTLIENNFRFLRVRAFFHKTVRVCHVYCNFKIGFTCRITVIFGTLIDGSLLSNTLASNICFTYRNMFQNGVDALSKIVDAFSSKIQNFI